MGRNFRNIKAWDLADNLVTLIYQITKHFPREEQFCLTSQMRRAAISIPANIAEGAARASKRDYLRFLYIALASLSELEYYIHLIQKLGYLEELKYKNIKALQKETAYTLNGLIESVKKEL